MYSYGHPHMAEQKQDDQLEHTYSRYVRIRDVALKTCQKRWTIGKSGERGSGISVLAAHDDGDDEIYIYIYIIACMFISDHWFHAVFIRQGWWLPCTDGMKQWIADKHLCCYIYIYIYIYIINMYLFISI